jgi:ADP-ribose pyrophosphatase YjhB (NUDIX family)
MSDDGGMQRNAIDVERLRQIAIGFSANSRDGITFASNEFDLRRFRAIGDLANELLAMLSGEPVELFASIFDTDVGYATPKVDVRGAVFDEKERILLVRERVDGGWTLPGGWADPLDTPAAAVLREIREEAGIAAEVDKLVACWDREVQNPNPPMPVHIYKLFFLCRQVEIVGAPDPLEIDGIGWFEVDRLPALSLGRVNERQIFRMLAHRRDGALPTEFD